LIQDTIFSLLPTAHFDLIVTHGPRGEYTRHRRHEETCRAVIDAGSDPRVPQNSTYMPPPCGRAHAPLNRQRAPSLPPSAK